MSGLLQSSDAYIRGFLELVGQWVKDYYGRSQLPGYTLSYEVVNITHNERNYYMVHFDLVGYSDSVDIGNITIDADTIISEHNLPNAGF